MDNTLSSDLRKALNNLYDLNQLRSSPLCTRFAIDTFYDSPVRLQHILEDAIAALKPKSREAHMTHAWQIYELLSLRYLQQFSQKEVADQLGVSLSHMNRIQNMALEDLAMHLVGKYPPQSTGASTQDSFDNRSGDPAPDQSRTPENRPSMDHPGSDTPVQQAETAKDLDWMSVPSPEKSADLSSRLKDVLEIIQPFLEKYSVTLDITGVSAPLEVLVYPVALRQILLNLLTSAIHILPNGHIRLAVTRLENYTELFIDGREPGLAVLTEDIKTNLGIAVRFARLSGGNLVFAAEQNTWQAVLRLPNRAAIPVLIIDDSPDALQLLERFVADTPYRVIGATDPQQALILAESNHAQVIIIDVMMPQVDGWELLQKLRHHPATAHLPLVTCSILRQEELASSLGASAYLCKPVSQEDLLQVLDRLVGHAGLTPG